MLTIVLGVINVVLLLIIVFFVRSSYVVIDEDERGVVTIQGEYKYLLKPGGHMLPPIESDLYRFTNRTKWFKNRSRVATSGDMDSFESVCEYSVRIDDYQDVFEYFGGDYSDEFKLFVKETIEDMVVEYGAEYMKENPDKVNEEFFDKLSAHGELCGLGVGFAELRVEPIGVDESDFDWESEFKGIL